MGSKPTHDNQGCLETAKVPAESIRICEESVGVEIPSLNEAFLDVEICEEEGISLELDISLPSGPEVQIREKSVEITIPAASGSDSWEFEGNEMDWEDELHEEVNSGTAMDIHGWDELHSQIEANLKKDRKTLPVSQSTKLHLLRNFATLRLKGLRRMEASQEIACQWHKGKGTYFAHQICDLACHYQVFEQLQQER